MTNNFKDRASEIHKFNQLASEWWDEAGPMRPLHEMNSIRIKFILENIPFLKEQLRSSPSLTGMEILDLGCGAGILCEPLARLGAHVTGVDGAEENIKAAQYHWQQQLDAGLVDSSRLEYHCAMAEEWSEKHLQQYDIVTAMEMIEHVESPLAIFESCYDLLKPGGMLLMSTLNRTWASYGVAILGAEYLLRLLPKGTHDWRKFLKPSELARFGRQAGFKLLSLKGMLYNPYYKSWRYTDSLAVNYLIAFQKP